MIIDLHELLQEDNGNRSYHLQLEADVFETSTASYKIKDYDLQLSFHNEGKKHISSRCEGFVVLEIPCDRCLEPVDYKIDIDYFKQLDRSNSSVHLLAPNIDAYENILLAGDIDYIGNRLHGGIYALQHAVRSIIISIDYRAEEMSKDFSLQCIKRSQIKEKLNEIINSNWSTSISELNTDKINKWKKQFVNSRVSD